ncbi:hypothetical protein RB195_001235 [Necator americanus]|uniref:Uncharacterized protein n=1 Tax=Necator americanus TaxID=51031 RepID=A0ABR1DEK8_NECAM
MHEQLEATIFYERRGGIRASGSPQHQQQIGQGLLLPSGWSSAGLLAWQTEKNRVALPRRRPADACRIGPPPQEVSPLLLLGFKGMLFDKLLPQGHTVTGSIYPISSRSWHRPFEKNGRDELRRTSSALTLGLM